LRVTVDKMGKLDGQLCFICGRYLLNSGEGDLAYAEIIMGGPQKAKPERYHLFACPGCGKMAHKRCWYNVADKPLRGGLFSGPKGWEMKCPSCGHMISGLTKERKDWRRGYQIPDHPDSELPELYLADTQSYKAGSFFGKIGSTIGDFFKAVGLAGLSANEKSSISAAAERVGRTLQNISSQVFRLNVTPAQRAELKELKCQHCGAALPLPGQFDEAIVCQHCGTAHLL